MIHAEPADSVTIKTPTDRMARGFDGDVTVFGQLREKTTVGFQIVRHANRLGFLSVFVHGHEDGILFVSITTPELLHDRRAPRPSARQRSAL